VPALFRAVLVGVRESVSEERLDKLLRWVTHDPNGLSGFKLRRHAAVMSAEAPQIRYELMTARWFEPCDVLPGFKDCESSIERSTNGLNAIDMMSTWDIERYLCDDVLTKLDRASMAVSLESRVPILDHGIVEFALSLPLSFKRRNGHGKWVLREVLRRQLPLNIASETKKGFTVPVAKWLSGPLRDWGEELLNEARLRSQGLLNVEVVRRKWEEHVEGDRDWQKLLWPVMMFQAWTDCWSARNGHVNQGNLLTLETNRG
jgi:asparagine synthase (glutamine-hydrolysing)